LLYFQLSEQVSLYYHNKRASSDCIRKKLFLPSLFQDFFNWHMKTDVTASKCNTMLWLSTLGKLSVNWNRLLAITKGNVRIIHCVSHFTVNFPSRGVLKELAQEIAKNVSPPPLSEKCP